MISIKQLNAIDTKYFNVEEKTPGYVILQSKNTLHFWYIQSMNEKNSNVKILHSHHGNGNYHAHGKAPDFPNALAQIKKHDAYQLKNRKAEYHLGYYIPEMNQDDKPYFYF